MKKSTKRKIRGFAAFAMAVLMMGAFCGCGQSEDEQQAATEETVTTGQEANPIHELNSADELLKKTGIELEAPEGAESATYAYIDSGEGEEEFTAQVQFTLDGKEYCYRAKSTGMTNLNDYIKDTEYSDLAKAMMEGSDVGTDISGMYGPWNAAALVTVQGRDAVCAINDGEEGVVIWLDAVPGLIYSLSTDEGADQDTLMDIAEKIFVPAQGDVG